MTTQILCGIVGSRAYNLASPDSDIDKLAVHVAKTKEFLGLNAQQVITQTIHSTSPDFTSHEVGKFCNLALKANPTLLELLWLENYETQTPAGKLLTTNRHLFLSTQTAKKAYGGWALSEVHKITRLLSHVNIKEAENPHRIAKRAKHALRISIQGLLLLQTGEVAVDMTSYKEEIFEAGELVQTQPEKLVELIENKVNEINKAESVLPQEANSDAVNEILQEIRSQQILSDLQ